MGVCCTKTENRNKIDKKETDSLTLNQFTNSQNTAVRGKVNFPITLDQVNKSIDEWKELTKRRRLTKKPTDRITERFSEGKVFIEPEDEIKNCLNGLNEIKCEAIDIEGNRNAVNKHMLNANLSGNEEHLEIDNSNNEINQDFLNINKRNNRGFSDISSTIHFTALNSKDLVSSKFNKLHQHNYHNGNSIKSQSIVNVLDELNNNNANIFRKESANNLHNLNCNIHKERNKIFIRNNILTAKNEVKEISLSILEKSKITIKKRGDNVTLTNNMTNNMNNINISLNQQVNSYFIVNRTHENQINTIEEDLSKNNNDATIHSASIQTNLEFYQENVFYHVDKMNFNIPDEEGLNTSNTQLKMNSVVNGVTLIPWTKDTPDKLKTQPRKNVQFSPNLQEDIDGVRVEWKRLGTINSMIINAKSAGYSIYKASNEGLVIKQGLSNNCSLIAAIISISNFDKYFGKRLLNSIVNPVGKEKDQSPLQNKNGFYWVKIYFNSCCRYFEIDDYLPTLMNKDKTILSKTNDLTINLIEKAIIMLYNGNNPSTFTIRSNPAYEIYHLTGWMPEIVLFKDITNKESLWQRLHSNFTEGNIMVCIGTGALKDTICVNGNFVSTASGLIQDHSYAVVDVLELSDRKLMKCRNPWGHTIPSVNFNIRSVRNLSESEEKEIIRAEENGFFWIDWEIILDHFSYIFLAWNPQIYPCKYSFNSTWKSLKSNSKFHDENYSLEGNPQYLITIPEHSEDFEVRILLTKLISKLENSNKQRQTISFKLFWYEGYPIVYPIDHLRTLQNPFREVNSDVFIFEASNQVEQYVLVVLKNDGAVEEDIDVGYALDIFSFIEIDVKKMPKREVVANKHLKFFDEWKQGGNFTSLDFVFNPQYKLELSSPTHLQFKLETLIPSPVMVSVIENGNHVSQIPYDYIISNKNPGFYFNSFSYFECFLEAGEYNIICVCQDEKQVGKYTLEVNAVRNPKLINNDFKIEKIHFYNYPYVEELRGAWDIQNNKGLITDNIYAMIKNPGFVFYPTQKMKVKFALKSHNLKKLNNSIGIAEFPSMTVLLYKIDNQFNANKLQGNKPQNYNLPSFSLVMDGTNKICSAFGFYSDEIELDPSSNAMYMVVCINMNKSQNSKFDLEIYSSQRLPNVLPNTNYLCRKKNFNIYGKWDKNNNGGGFRENSFLKNSQYEIITTKSTSAYFELSSHDGHMVSFLIIEHSQGESAVDKIQETINNNTNEEYALSVYSRALTLEQGRMYVLIPFTKSPSNFGYYDLTLSTDEELFVKEITSKV